MIFILTLGFYCIASYLGDDAMMLSQHLTCVSKFEEVLRRSKSQGSDENRARPQPSITSNGRFKNGNTELIDFTYTMRRHWMLTWKTQTREKPREPTDSELSTMR